MQISLVNRDGNGHCSQLVFIQCAAAIITQVAPSGPSISLREEPNTAEARRGKMAA
jgi:hypothetical protein